MNESAGKLLEFIMIIYRQHQRLSLLYNAEGNEWVFKNLLNLVKNDILRFLPFDARYFDGHVTELADRLLHGEGMLSGGNTKHATLAELSLLSKLYPDFGVLPEDEVRALEMYTEVVMRAEILLDESANVDKCPKPTEHTIRVARDLLHNSQRFWGCL